MAYNRVNWENGSVKKEGYVIIDGETYQTVQPEYEGNTPLNDENLNIMDKGIADAHEEIGNLKPTILYNNPNNRTAGGVTLSDSANNYSYLEIYGYSTTNNCTVYEKISAPYSSFVFMIADGSTTDNYYVNFKSITYAINGSTISYSYSREINFKKSTKVIFNYGESQTIYITKVIGIK